MSNNPALWSSIGFWILMGGLAGDFIILFLPSGKVEKRLAAMFTVLIAIGVAVEHRADAIRFGPRILSPAQQRAMISQVAPFAGTEFTIRAYNDDEDAVNLMLVVAATLTKGGWVQMPPTGVMGFLFVKGVSVEVRPPNAAKLEPAAKVLAKALLADGIEATEKVGPGTTAEANMVVIRIGHKPR